MEIIISIAIFGLLALLAGEIMTSMNMVMRATDQINDRLSYETKFADNMQTKDASGTPFASTGITYSISYGGTPLGGSKTALEYRMNYDDPRASGSGYVAGDVNYRFMSFEKVDTHVSTTYEPNFKVIVRFVPYFSDAIPSNNATAKAEIQKAQKLLDSVNDIKVTMKNGELLTTPPPTPVKELGTPWIIDVKNTANIRAADVSSVSATIHFDVFRDWFGDSSEKIFTESDVELYYFVKVGSATDTPDPSADPLVSGKNETFYNRCIVEYNLNTGEFKPFKSLTAADSDPAYPTHADYEAIVTG